MGLTMGCARCHSHKFDPITHKEFYQFFAFFNSLPEEGLAGQKGNADPVLPLPSAAQQAQLDELTSAIETRKAALDRRHRRAAAARVGSRRSPDAPPSIDTTGLIAHYEMDGSFSDISGRYQHGRTITGDPTFDDGPIGKAASFDGDTEVSFGNVGAFDRAISLQRGRVAEGPRQPADEHLSEARRSGASSWLRVAIRRRDARGDPEVCGATGNHLRIRRGQRHQIRTHDRLRLGHWYQVTLTYDGSGKASGVRLYVDGQRYDVDVQQDTLIGSFATAAPLRLGSKALGKPFYGALDDLRLYSRVLTTDQIEQLAIHYRPR